MMPRRLAMLLAAACAAAMAAAPAVAAGEVDVALIVSVDVSNSVDARRYRLQMEGIAEALEDRGVQEAILNGPQGAILFSMIQWADRPQTSVGWTRIASPADALALAAKVRKVPRNDGEFTCMSRMMRYVYDKVQPQIPVRAMRVVMDVSGDGVDNCNAGETTEQVRDELVAAGMIINGLPIVERQADAAAAASPPAAAGPGAVPLEPWYREHVIGGPGAFVLRADGYSDFGRAIRQKFVVEISGLELPSQTPPSPALPISVPPSLAHRPVQAPRGRQPDRLPREVDQARGGDVGAGEAGAADVGPGQVRGGELGAVETGPRQVRLAQRRELEHHARQVGADQ